VLVPIAVITLVRWWPSTPLGKLILLKPAPEEEILPDLSPLYSLVGRYGTARSKMLPSGAILVDGRIHDALSEGIPIEAGTSIKVVAVRGRSLVVRPGEPPLQQEGGRQRHEEDLARPIDDVTSDPFADPLP
jgi:membrane-bound serine protease (ClpP class)